MNGRDLGSGSGAARPDAELTDALAVVDPAYGDPAYWVRFRFWVLGAASAELRRRRWLAQATVGDVVQSWAKMLVPVAVATALAAGLLLVEWERSEAGLPISIEELLVTEIDGDPIPVMLQDEEAGAVAFAAEVF